MSDEHIAIVDDEADMEHCILELLDAIGIKCKTSFHEELVTLCQSSLVPTLLIIDISSIHPINLGPHGAYSAICSFIKKFPGAPVIINSAVSENFAECIKEDILEHEPEAIIYIVDKVTGLKDLESTLRRIYGIEGERVT